MAVKEFSVLTSIYYKENPEWLREALDSVFAQTLQPTEFVLVKDGPLTNELESVLAEYIQKYPIFKVIQNETNLGLGLALQKGVEACSNEIIARMDTDDIIPSYRFEKEYNAIEKGNDVVSCWSQIFVGDTNNVVAVKKRPEYHAELVKLAHKRSPICHAGTMFRKSAVLKAGNYQHCPLNEDYHLWIRMIMSGAKFYCVQEVLYFVRTNPEQISRRGGMKYLVTELKSFVEFKKMGFYTYKDLALNSAIRIMARLSPRKLRVSIMKKAWKHKSV